MQGSHQLMHNQLLLMTPALAGKVVGRGKTRMSFFAQNSTHMVKEKKGGKGARCKNEGSKDSFSPTLASCGGGTGRVNREKGELTPRGICARPSDRAVGLGMLWSGW